MTLCTANYFILYTIDQLLIIKALFPLNIVSSSCSLLSQYNAVLQHKPFYNVFVSILNIETNTCNELTF